MDALHSVSVAKVAELLDLNNLTKEMNLKERAIECSDVNRPALQLSGYFDHFEERRIQIIGNVEYTYIEKMSDSEKKERYSRFMEFDIPCIIFCRDLQPDEIFMEEAREHGIPVLSTGRSTSSFMAELIYCLGEQLAPCITVHGVLVDVYGEGVMITGESGIGKSEAALELIRRGHRLVTDDVVEIRKINEHTLMGTSPEITRHFIELRGIGIIDDSDASKLYKVSGNLRRCAHERMLVDLSDFHHIIRHKTMASSDELECGLALSDTALACDHYSLAVYIYQHAVHCNARCELLTKTIDELSHKA